MSAISFADAARAGGHLLVVQGDLTKLAVDAVLVPCDSDGNTHRGFVPLLGAVEKTTFSAGFVRVPAFPGGVVENERGGSGAVYLGDDAGPQVWLLDTTIQTRTDADGLFSAVDDALDRIARALHDPAESEHAIGSGATLAMPLVGVNEGGFGDSYFDIISGLVPLLEARAAALGVDVVLVARARSDYAAVQHLRRDQWDERVGADVSDDADSGDGAALGGGIAPGDGIAAGDADGGGLVEVGNEAAGRALNRLAELAREGRLVPFIGAGASIGAGAPSWSNLLRDLARAAGLSEEEIPTLLDLDPRDAAMVIAHRNTDSTPAKVGQQVRAARYEQIKEQITEKVSGDRYTVTQGLIAGLALPEAVTTNYDMQYELARLAVRDGSRHDADAAVGDEHVTAAAANAESVKSSARAPVESRNDEFVVLPQVRPRPGSPWVLKIHGDVARPESIVISREDYLRFDRDSGPAAGVLQSRMLTGHLLFVGYSMSDENIVRLARDVQRYREGFAADNAAEPVGTVLELMPNRLRQELWAGTLDFVTFGEFAIDGDSQGAQDEEREAVRRLRVFLDRLAMLACDDVPFLLDAKYRDLVLGSAADTNDDADAYAAGEVVRLLAALDAVGEAARAVESADRGAHSAALAAARLVRELLDDMGVG